MKWSSVNRFVLLLALGACDMNGCTTSPIKEELELTAYDTAQDHRKIAAYYRHEAATLRQTSEEMFVRIAVYERLFGPASNWVAGTRLLAQSYENAAKEQEQKAREHLELINASRPSSIVGSGFH